MPKDEKDWTWVLERVCPDCGFDASTTSADQVANLLRDIAAAWEPLLSDPLATTRPSEHVWSAVEYGCHVRDVCRIYDGRLRRMLTEDDPLYPNWDQDQTAVDDRYAEQDPSVVADALRAAAAELADRFDQVTGAQWARTGRRSDGAGFTVDTFARYFIHDPVHHLHDVHNGFATLRDA